MVIGDTVVLDAYVYVDIHVLCAAVVVSPLVAKVAIIIATTTPFNLGISAVLIFTYRGMNINIQQKFKLWMFVQSLDHSFLAQSMCLSMLWETASPTPEGIPKPSHGRVFHEKFWSVYVVKGA